MHFPTVALIGRYQDTGLDAPLRALALALTGAGRKVLVDADTARNTGVTEYPVATLEEIGRQATLAVVMGGDGTVLGAARHLAQRQLARREPTRDLRGRVRREALRERGVGVPLGDGPVEVADDQHASLQSTAPDESRTDENRGSEERVDDRTIVAVL